MTKSKTADELLTVALQDLRAAAELVVKRLPAIVAQVGDAKLAADLDAMIETAEGKCSALLGTGRAKGGASNLWMDGILDDAKRDTKSVEQGPLLDVALIGAVRKALAATIVSDETAIALAEGLGQKKVADILKGAHDADRKSNAALGRMLARITSQAPQ